MSRDLEESLEELGPEARAVVARLKAGREVEDVRRETEDGGLASRVFRLMSFRRSCLAAASLLLILGLIAVFRTSNIKRQTSNPELAARAPRPYTLSVEEMIATQNPDGSWANDFLTRRNAAILAKSDARAAQIAYKRAMRNLRVRGVL